MAKASAHITLTYLVDVVATYRYYKLQSSTATAPAVPSTNPPSGWTDVEPTYVEGSTNTLYTVDLTIFSNNTWSYSKVSKSTSYEAAKIAYNKAVNAQNTANNADLKADDNYDKIASRGEQLVTNGTGFMGNNTNFSSLVFDGSQTNNSQGSFTRPPEAVYVTRGSDELFPIDATQEYEIAFDMKSSLSKSSMFSFIRFYDIDKNEIMADNHIYVPGTLTTLSQDLKNGDTVIHLNDVSAWSTTASYGHYIIVWNYKNSKGYQYPPETYSRNTIRLPNSGNYLSSSSIDTTNNTIILASAYTGSTIPSGTQVSQGGTGSTFKYNALSNALIPTVWTHYSGTYRGTDYSGKNVSNRISPGTAYGKVGFLWNYNRDPDDQVWVTNVSVRNVTRINELNGGIENANESLTDIDRRLTMTETAMEIINGILGITSSDGESSSTLTQTPEGWTFMTGIESTIGDINKLVEQLTETSDSSAEAIKIFEEILSELKDRFERVHIGHYVYTDENNIEQTEPCIEFYESDTDFRLLITNTRAVFFDGSNELVVINSKTNSLEAEKIKLKGNSEFKQGGFSWVTHGVSSNKNLGLIWTDNINEGG